MYTELTTELSGRYRFEGVDLVWESEPQRKERKLMHRILVPTDGSELSERALPVAEALAAANGAEITLVRVVQPPTWNEIGAEGYLAGEIYEDVVAGLMDEAEQNVVRLAERMRSEGRATRAVVLEGAPAASLVEYEAEAKPDLVVMASHGRTGLARSALGSVADRMVREGVAPVVIVRSAAPGAYALRRAVVPLDGSALAEEALATLQRVAVGPLHYVHLLRVIDSDADLGAASIYLAGVARRLAASGLFAVPDVVIEPAAPAICRAARDADLVIMATHGRGGLDRMRYGSVAEHVLQRVTTPLLLVRARRSRLLAALRAGAAPVAV